MNKKINVFLIILAYIVIIPSLALAANFKVGGESAFVSSEKSDSNLYIVGANVTSNGLVQGDLLIAGGSIFVNGPIAGDLMMVGGNTTVSSDVAGDLRSGNGNITVSGEVQGDVIIGAGQINLMGQFIGGDVAVGGGVVRIESTIKGDLKIAGGEVFLNAPVLGNVNIQAEKITLGPKANIAGDLTYKSSEELVMEEGAIVQGKVDYTELSHKGGKTDFRSKMGMIFSFLFISKFLMFLLAGLILGLVFKRYSKQLVTIAIEKPLAEFARGIIALIVLPILSLILCISVIGLPLGILGFLSFAMIIIYMVLATPLFLGSLVYKWIFKTSNEVSWNSILLGVIVFMLLGIIPFIGWILVFIAMCITLGSTLNIKWRLIKEWM